MAASQAHARRCTLLVVGVVGAVLLVLAACTSRGARPATTSPLATSRSSGVGRPLTGPTTSTASARCPFVDEQRVVDDTGMRLGRITTQVSGGKAVGCRIYAQDHPNAQCDETCLANEHLPPATQPAVEIDSTRYGDAAGARTALIAAAQAGTAVQQDEIGPGTTGLCFQTSFWRPDAGKDWVCGFSVGATVVTIRTVVTSPALDVVEIARAVAPKF